VADALLATGHRVLIVDDLSTGRKDNVPAGAELHVLDIRSAAAAALLAGAASSAGAPRGTDRRASLGRGPAA
jgi:nucleoside-diphosphate-sugar epimerase